MEQWYQSINNDVKQEILMKRVRLLSGVLLCTLATGLFVGQAQAVPSFARQTGMACAACHTVFPELNSFGRSFKLNGYTLTGIKQVEAQSSSAASGLQFNQIPPLSMMLQVADTNTSSQEPSNEITLPDELSFFFAGEISPHMGSFIQMTMEQGTGFSLDNTDIRFADRSGDVTYGVTLNNNPTIQDLWNSTPGWGYPWTHGAGITAPVIADALAQNVAGIGGYADWGNGLYTELTLYGDTGPFDAPSGAAPGPVRIHNIAPYGRIAWGKNLNSTNYLMVGAYGMHTSLTEDGNDGGPQDKYSDFAVDTQWEHQMSDNNMISVHARYTNEKQTLDLSAAGSPTLKSFRIDGTYHWGYRTTATLGYANNSGGDGAFDDSAITGQVSYLPWQNTKFTLQYVAYTKLGGTTSGASDNNTLLLQAWLMW